ALTDRDASVRRFAALALGEIGPAAKAAVPALSNRLMDKNARARADLARALKVSEAAMEGLYPKLSPAPLEENGLVRCCTARALWRIEKHSLALPTLLEALRDRGSPVRVTAAQVLGEMGPEARKAVPLLIETLGDRDVNPRLAVAHALGKI